MLRTLGPHSVSSVLKIILDVVFVLLFIAIIWLGLVAMLSAVAMSHPGFLLNWAYPGGRFRILATSPGGAGLLVVSCLNILASIVVVGRLRKIFVTLVAGNPFQAENARRLRVIGLTLLAAEVARIAVRIMIWGMPMTARSWWGQLNFVGWFSIAILFVLAEVLEEGVRLRREAELTI
jgi:hypothetical protein